MLLFRKNTALACSYRMIIDWQWGTIGRASENAKMPVNELTYSVGARHTCIELDMDRAKTSTNQTIRLFLHAEEWLQCTFHSLATCIALGSVDAEGDILSTFTKDNIVQNINHMLDEVYEEFLQSQSDNLGEFCLTQGLTSHSNRSGPITFANEHPNLQIQWLILRGGWSVDSIQTLLHYLAGTFGSDAPVGRVLAGWLDETAGGICPDYTCIPIDERDLFTQYSILLLSSVAFDDTNFCRALCIVLIMHFEKVRQDFPEHLLNCKMIDTATLLGIDGALLSSWSLLFRNSFLRKNQILTPEDEETLVVPGGQITTALKNNRKKFNCYLKVLCKSTKLYINKHLNYVK